MTLDFTQDHNKGIFYIDGPKALIVDGPRGSGKTALINQLFHFDALFCPVKFRQFASVPAVSHPEASIIRMDYLARFIGQLPVDLNAPIPVFDRFIGTEIVMSRITRRASEAQLDLMWELDELWARFAVQVILQCNTDERLRRAAGRADEGDSELLNEYWGGYTWRTRIPTVVIDTAKTPLEAVVGITRTFVNARRGEWNIAYRQTFTDDSWKAGDAAL